MKTKTSRLEMVRMTSLQKQMILLPRPGMTERYPFMTTHNSTKSGHKEWQLTYCGGGSRYRGLVVEPRTVLKTKAERAATTAMEIAMRRTVTRAKEMASSKIWKPTKSKKSLS